MTLVQLPGDCPGKDKVRALRSNHLSDVTLDVVECEEQLTSSIVIDQAWVFRDDYFIVKDQEHNLYTSVEVNSRASQSMNNVLMIISCSGCVLQKV